MRKEYADLPDNQKIIYYKRGAVFGLCVALPIVLLMGSMFGIISYYAPLIDGQQNMNSTDTNTNNKPPTTNPVFEASLFLFMTMAVMGFAGIGAVGTELGNWVCDKLKLYTDFQLEAAEKRVAEIKKELTK